MHPEDENDKPVFEGRFNLGVVSLNLPMILAKGILKVDLYLHHPMVEYQMMAVDCCSLESEGFQSGYGRALEHQQNGFMGL